MFDISVDKPPEKGRYITYNPSSAFNVFMCSNWCGDAWEHDIYANHKKYIPPKTWVTHWDYLPEAPIK